MHIFDVNMFGMADLCFASLQDSGSYMGQSIHEWMDQVKFVEDKL